MPPLRKKDFLFGTILLFAVATGAIDVAYPALIDNYLVVYVIALSVLAIYWLYLDASEFEEKRPAGYVILFALLVVPVGIWLHLMRTRRALNGTITFALVLSVCILAYAIGSFGVDFIVD